MSDKKKILVVEDEKNVALLIKEELKDEGYDVKVAYSGEEALDILKKEDFDAITLDIEMPGMNGLEVAGKIREFKKNARIILLSAYSHYKSDFSSWAADAYVIKSSNLSELKETLKRLMG